MISANNAGIIMLLYRLYINYTCHMISANNALHYELKERGPSYDTSTKKIINYEIFTHNKIE